MRELAFLRRILVEIGNRLGVGEGIFHLTPAEIRGLQEATSRDSKAVRLILERQEELEALRELQQLPREITVAALEGLDVEGGANTMVPRASTELRGTRVAGKGDVIGRARVLRRAEEIDSFRKGEILVARFTDPTWTSVFPLARGIVTEVGGWLSHAAIQAREYGITGIVGAEGALDALRNGDLVSLRADGTIDRFDERRLEHRAPISVRIDLRRASETVHAHLGDVSHRGALLLVPERQLTIGERVDLDIPAISGPVEATVIRNGLPGIYGLRLERELDPAQAPALGASLAKRAVQGAA
jgi:phosphohistidine swiveling domain-containing protein